MQVDVFEPGSSAASCLMPVRPAHPRSERHVFQHGQMTEQQVILKYNTGGSPLGRNEYATCRIVESLTVKLDVPVRYAQQTGQGSQSCAIACPVVAQLTQGVNSLEANSTLEYA